MEFGVEDRDFFFLDIVAILLNKFFPALIDFLEDDRNGK
jgi:hypothetical protein